MAPTISIDDLAERLLRGERRALAQACTLAESTVGADVDATAALLERVVPFIGTTRRIGMTGSPGVGKSTFIESWGMSMINDGHRVAVLAVDPSSYRTGGSILGDKVRMQRLGLDNRAFVRPQASRLMLGGAAAATMECTLLCEAAGFDTIIVETVGVGQNELDVVDLVDAVVVLVLPTAGDELQGMKRGIMEIADVVMITKADLDPAATNRARAIHRSAMAMMHGQHPSWQARVVDGSGVAVDGHRQLAEALDAFFDDTRRPAIASHRHHQRLRWFDRLADRGLLAMFDSDVPLRAIRAAARRDVASAAVTPTAAAVRMLSAITILPKVSA